MARVVCSLPNASDRISGVAFAADRGEMISEEVGEDVAARFASIPGYRIAHQPQPAAAEKAAAAAPAAPAPSVASGAVPPVPGDANGDGKLSAAERRAHAKAASAKGAQPAA